MCSNSLLFHCFHIKLTFEFIKEVENALIFFLLNPILIFCSFMLSLLILLAFSCYFHYVGFVGYLFIMEQFHENKNLKMNSGIEIFENEMFMEDEQIIETSIITTLTLGSQPRQGLAKVAPKSEARKSHFMLLRVWESVRE